MSAEIFIAYSRADESMKDALLGHLSPLRRSGLITAWHDRLIKPGTDWQNEIDSSLNRCRIFLPLISSDFIASDYCYGIEMQRGMERNARGKAQLIPVILRPCLWSHLPFAKLQVLPKDGKPVVSWPHPDEAYADVAKALYALLISSPPAAISPTGDSKPTSITPQPSVSGVGPEIVVDYSYAEDSNDHRDPNAPLGLHNISLTEQAYNVEVQPLKLAHGTVEFEPRLIPYIETGKSKNVFAVIKEGSPLFRKRLPDFLFGNYKDESAEELFGVKTFTLLIRYRGQDQTKFVTECDLNFKPWKKRVTVGRTERKPG